MGDVVLGADAFKPVGTSSTGRHDDAPCVDALLAVSSAGDHAAAHVVFNHEILAFGAKTHVDARAAQVLLDGKVELLGLFGAQMADGAVDHLEAGLDGTPANIADLRVVPGALNMRIGAEREVQLVDRIDGVLRLLRADELGQVAAYLVGEGELAIGKCAGA